MCGITGYIGTEDAKQILLKSLEKLEYRGYDSAGIALIKGEGIHVFKEKGRIADLCGAVDKEICAQTGIGHTRWATHGEPSRANAHPHISASGRFALVHNGVIVNETELKSNDLKGVHFQSETDTEVIVQLVEKFSQQLETEEAFRKTLSLLKGSYAIAMLDAEKPDTIYTAKNKSPLLVGVGEGFHVVASDATAMIHVTDQFIELMDQEVAIITKEGVQIRQLDGSAVYRPPYKAEMDVADIEKGSYPHFMLKEMDEQPFVIRRIIQAYQNENGDLDIGPELIRSVLAADRMYIIACGTSYHAGLVGKQLIEKMANIPVEVHLASEFGYNMPLLSDKPFFIFISQSGETADSRAVLAKVKEMGHQALTITNAAGSTLSREADFTLLLHAGPEIAVASTKAYTAQIAVLAILASAAGAAKGVSADVDLIQELGIIANAMETLCDAKGDFEQIAAEYLPAAINSFFIGRSVDYYVCLEGALKLKEISYIQAEGFAGGELKHGTIALIEKETPVIALVTQANVNGHIRANVKETAARGAHTCIISMEGLEEEGDRFVLPRVHELLTPLVSVIPLQFIAYYAALHRGCDVDKPRNLAKSVTVE